MKAHAIEAKLTLWDNSAGTVWEFTVNDPVGMNRAKAMASGLRRIAKAALEQANVVDPQEVVMMVGAPVEREKAAEVRAAKKAEETSERMKRYWAERKAREALAVSQGTNPNNPMAA